MQQAQHVHTGREEAERRKRRRLRSSRSVPLRSACRQLRVAISRNKGHFLSQLSASLLNL